MSESKIYTIGGKQFLLKQKFTVADWEASKKVDSFFSNIKLDRDNTEILQKTTKEDFIELMHSVLKPVDNTPVEESFFLEMGMEEGLEVFTDFFFVYLNSNLSMQKHLKRSEEKAKKFAEKLSD
jgi:hypothetical protein